MIVDTDPQASATVALGYRDTDELKNTIAVLMVQQVGDENTKYDDFILKHCENIDLIPANIELSGMETTLLNVMSRETVLKNCFAELKQGYDYTIIDCMPSLSIIPVNALAAADSVIVPVQPQYLSLKGMDQLLSTVAKVKKKINPDLSIEGILLTMTDMRTNLAREIKSLIYEKYDGKIPIFRSEIPLAVKAAEATAAGKSVFAYDPSGKVAAAYAELAKEMEELAKEVNGRGERIKYRDADERVRCAF